MMMMRVCDCMQGIHVTAYSPMGTPPSSSMFKDYQPKLAMDDPLIKELATKYKKNVGQVDVTWPCLGFRV